MTRVQQHFRNSVCSAALLSTLGACSFLAAVEVKPSDCINPRAGEDCSGANVESRILDVRLYQLKQAVDPCKQSVEAFAVGKDLEELKSALVDSQREEDLRYKIKVTAGEPRNLGNWLITKDTQYVLAMAIGRGRSENSVRLIPIDRLKTGGGRLPTLYFKGYDICLDQPCDGLTEKQCQK